MRYSFTILLILIAFYPGSCQSREETFLKRYGGGGFDRGVTVEELHEGNGYIVTGYTTGSGEEDQDVLLLRTDGKGIRLWQKTIGGPGNDNGWAVRRTGDGGYVVAGFTDSYGAGGMDIYLIRTDDKGDTLWTRTYGKEADEYGWDVRLTADGGFIVAAQTASTGNGEIDAYLVKTDANGNLEWGHTYGGEQVDRVFSVQQTPDDGYVAAGITYSFGAGDRDAFLLKTDAAGDQEWMKTFGGPGYDVGHSVALTMDGGYLVTGYGDSFTINGDRDVYLIKTDAAGTEKWTKVVGGPLDERGIKGYQTREGGYVATGFTDSHFDLYLIRTNSAGDTLWTRTIGEPNRVEFGYTVRETQDGGFILTGHTQDFQETESDLLLIKTDMNGNWK